MSVLNCYVTTLYMGHFKLLTKDRKFPRVYVVFVES